ncbi:J domain-containing protein spf31 [Cytospora mali]|uniref:J domain-containing protein spf31 n=1 Tax=Cytospora mali TaxID=578113 RepID=A0A194VX46_CYTMA|nr:J domain-containing protein spf31 [Valsa mali]
MRSTFSRPRAKNGKRQDAEIDRILKAFRLDAYAVLGLKPGVPDTDIKNIYRKKSLLIHPDKTKNPRAPDAFDRLKKAQTELMDEKHRERLDEAISDARMLLIRENKWTVDSPEVKEPDAEFEKKWAEKTVQVLIDNEQRRRRQLKGQMQEEGRQQRKEDTELDERKRKRQHEQDWEATREQRIDSWRSFQKGKTGGEPSKKKKKMKPIG